MKRIKYKGIIFDFNGVLLWDSHLHELAWKDFSTFLRGSPVSSEEINKHVHGRPNKYVLEYILNHQIAPEELNALSNKKEAVYQRLCLQNSSDFKLSPGAVDLLDDLNKNKILHTIATASDRNNLDFFIKHLKLDKFFDVAKIIYDDGSFMDKREMFIKAAENLDLSLQDCIVIEDSISGIGAANKAGIGKIIAFGPTVNHNQLLKLKGVSFAITSLNQINTEEIL